VRAVNLLPERHRPRQPTGSGKGSSYVLLGVLGALLVGVLVYVLTLNSINSARSDVTSAKAETARLQAQARQLGPYGDFAKIKQQRVAAVRSLAEQRFDWERLVRELAHVLPSGVWLTQTAAAQDAQHAQDTPASASTGSSSSSTAANAPVLSLQGCAQNQSDVAVALVRLRELQGATTVTLDHSTRGADSSGSGGSSSSNSTGDCGTSHGQPNYSFQVNVAFSPQAAAPYKPGDVPTSLGGGQ
jgi:Tfp pilus assembly protein PilN